MPRTLFLALAPAALLLATPAKAQAPAPGLACPVSAKPVSRLELYFGAGRVNAPEVTREQWEAFLDAEITPRFPDGLTFVEARGQWRGASGAIVRERSWLLIVMAPPGEASEAAVEAIRAAWKSRFDQDSVMRANSVACVTF